MQVWTSDARAFSIERMRKQVQGKAIAAGRDSSAAKTVDDYLTGVAEPAREMLIQMRSLIRSLLPPEATETISYQIPAFKYKKVVVWFAAFKNHCSLFPTAAVIEECRSELKGYTVSKGTVQFPLEKALPVKLIRKLVKVRLQQMGAKG